MNKEYNVDIIFKQMEEKSDEYNKEMLLVKGKIV